MIKLLAYWKTLSCYSHLANLVATRMKAVLEEVSKVSELISYLACAVSYPLPYVIIKTRTMTVLRKVLPLIFDMRKLISYRKNVSYESGLKKLIDERIEVVLQNLSSDNIPEWFWEIVEERLDLPGNFDFLFQSKAAEVYIFAVE